MKVTVEINCFMKPEVHSFVERCMVSLEETEKRRKRNKIKHMGKIKKLELKCDMMILKELENDKEENIQEITNPKSICRGLKHSCSYSEGSIKKFKNKNLNEEVSFSLTKYKTKTTHSKPEKQVMKTTIKEVKKHLDASMFQT
ncbi:hypothetical protein ACFE04_022903 [Oxalis oulophora]